MQALIFLEARDVIEAALAGIVWQMQADSPIYTNHEHAHVVTDTHTGAYSHLLIELSELEGFIL